MMMMSGRQTHYVRELKRGIKDFPLSALMHTVASLIGAHHQLSLPSITLQALTSTGKENKRTTQSLHSRSHFLPIISVRRIGVDAFYLPFSS